MVKDVKRRFLAYSFPPRSPDPPHLAVLARPGFVRAAPALPATTRIRLPSATATCCDRPQAKVSHLHSNHSASRRKSDVRQVRRSSIPEPTSTSSTPFASGSTHRLPARTREGGRACSSSSRVVPSYRKRRTRRHAAPRSREWCALRAIDRQVSHGRTGTRHPVHVSRQSVYTWKARYAAAGIDGLREATRRPWTSPSRLAAETEALVCELRRAHPRWCQADRLRGSAAGRGVRAVAGDGAPGSGPQRHGDAAGGPGHRRAARRASPPVRRSSGQGRTLYHD